MIKIQMQERGVTITPESLAGFRSTPTNWPWPHPFEVHIIDRQGDKPHIFEVKAWSPISYDPPAPPEEGERRR